MDNRRIDVKPLAGNWFYGKIGRFRFQAKVFDAGSEFGIGEGCVSKLSVWDADREIIGYDRGWGKKPGCSGHR
jgi:hypothetical protein